MKRADFLPEIGQAVIKGMCADTVAALKKGHGQPSYCLEKLFTFANIPLDFQRRWSAERAIHDCMLKARDYGMVTKACGGLWRYAGPEVEKTTKEIRSRRKAAKSAAVKHLRGLGFRVSHEDVSIADYGGERGKLTARVTLPKKMWVKM